ncbi:MAG: hypothetical protein DRJ52_08360 [Thermoprotei archaeon]|nr:MAG: hypothetical protein DRJ52_08360 [Thermoprotei archaeon]
MRRREGVIALLIALTGLSCSFLARYLVIHSFYGEKALQYLFTDIPTCIVEQDDKILVYFNTIGPVGEPDLVLSKSEYNKLITCIRCANIAFESIAILTILLVGIIILKKR